MKMIKSWKRKGISKRKSGGKKNGEEKTNLRNIDIMLRQQCLDNQ